MKANRKRLKAALALRVRKFGLLFLVSKLGKFPLFDNFLDIADFLLFEFPDLDDSRPFDNFPNLDNFKPFDNFPDLHNFHVFQSIHHHLQCHQHNLRQAPH